MRNSFSKKVIIVCQHGYSGGITVLSLLCKLLNERGIDARLFYIGRKPRKGEVMWKYWFGWMVNKLRSYYYPLIVRFSKNEKRRSACQKYLLVSFKGLPVQRFPFFSRKNSIVIYPDSVYGNFLCAKNVVRYFLYYNPFPDDTNAYGKEDLFIAYREIYVDRKINPEGNLLTLWNFDSTLYQCYNKGERKGNCYIIRKGRFRADLPLEFDGPIIDNLSEVEKVKVLNECQYCYSYDLQTFYSTIAAVCGCISVIVFEPEKTAKDYYSEEEVAQHVGIAYGDTPDEIAHAVNTADELRKRLDYTESNHEQIEQFVGLLTKKFG